MLVLVCQLARGSSLSLAETHTELIVKIVIELKNGVSKL